MSYPYALPPAEDAIDKEFVEKQNSALSKAFINLNNDIESLTVQSPLILKQIQMMNQQMDQLQIQLSSLKIKINKMESK